MYFFAKIFNDYKSLIIFAKRLAWLASKYASDSDIKKYGPKEYFYLNKFMVIAAEACGRWKFPTLPQKKPKKQKQKQETKTKKKGNEMS